MRKIAGNKILNNCIVIVNIILVSLTILGVIKTCFVGFDIDEAYAVAQSYRMVMGDNMFSQMWESHQMSAFGLAPFILLYMLFTGGETTGIVLFLRVVGTIIHLLIGFWFFKMGQKKFGTTVGLLISLAHINFLPKWLVLAEFEIMQYWSVCVIFLGLLTWYGRLEEEPPAAIEDEKQNSKRKKDLLSYKKADKWLIISGLSLFVAMMTYPTMILLYPVYVVALWVLRSGTVKERMRCVLIFTGTTLAVGVAFLIYLRSYMTVDEFLRYVSYIFMDESHTISLGTKIVNYGKELLHFGKTMLLYSPVALVVTAIVAMLDYIPKPLKSENRNEVNSKSFQDEKESKENAKEILAEAAFLKRKNGKMGNIWTKWLLMFLLFWLGIFVGKHVILSVFGDKNQFFLYFRYMVAVLVGFIGAFYCFHKNKPYFWLGILPGIVGVAASAMVTNMSLEVAMARIYIGVMAGIFIICTVIKEKYNKDMMVKGLGYVLMVSFLIGLVICKLIMVRVTGCIPVTLRMDMDFVKEGPAAGLYVQEELAKQYNENVPLIKEYVDENDNLLYFGCENIYYMVAGADLSTPSVQGTTVFNEMFIKYYEEYPERKPNVIIIDKTFATNPYYNYAPQNQIVLDWIEENYPGAARTDMEYLTILQE